MQESSQPEHTSQRLLWNPILGERVVQSPGRMNRREGVADCPFCEDIATQRWPVGQDTWIRPNDFPALQPPLGECYILLYARQHDLLFADMELDRVAAVVDLWQEVYLQLSPRYSCVMTFENSGAEIGQTQHHPHGQTYGVSFLPPTIDRELAQVDAYQAAHGTCLFCDVLQGELGGPRVVFESPHVVGFIPAWARYPYEVHLYLRAHLPHLGALPRGGEGARELAQALRSIVRGWNQVVESQMPYMLVVHQLADPRFHLHLELLPVKRSPQKLKFAASSESGFGLWLNDALPEMKAAELRGAMAQADLSR